MWFLVTVTPVFICIATLEPWVVLGRATTVNLRLAWFLCYLLLATSELRDIYHSFTKVWLTCLVSETNETRGGISGDCELRLWSSWWTFLWGTSNCDWDPWRRGLVNCESFVPHSDWAHYYCAGVQVKLLGLWIQWFLELLWLLIVLMRIRIQILPSSYFLLLQVSDLLDLARWFSDCELSW